MTTMVAVTLADLAYRYRQFLIAIIGAGLVMSIALVLSGLTNGFTAETDWTVAAAGANRWIITTASEGRIASVGVFPQSDLTLIGGNRGARSDPITVFPQQVVEVGDGSVTVNVMGVRPGGLGDPRVTRGHTVEGSGQVVVDVTAGIPLGAHVRVGSLHLRVVGLVSNRTLLGGGPMAYFSLRDTQLLNLGGRPLATAVLTTGDPTSVPAGLQVLTNSQVESNTIASLGPAVSSINSFRILMWIIAGVIIAALLYVSALQRVQDFAILKALGSSNAALLGSLALQAVLVSLAAAAFAAIVSNFMGGLFKQPIDIPASSFFALPIIAVVVGILSSLVALRQATGADPAAAFG
jgi:putative ABC transport system permease protein